MAVVAAWGPLSWRFESTDEAELAWLDAHFHVSAVSASACRRFVDVRSVRDDDRIGSLTHLPADRAPVRIRETWYRGVRADDGLAWTTARSGDLPAHAFVRHARDRWSVLVAEEPRSPRPAEILVRALVVDELVRGGGVALHASAAANPSGAMVFTGDGGAGKSTLAAWCARSGGHLVAGDRIVVLPGGVAVGAAVAPRFGWGTVAALGRVGAVRGARLLRPDAVRADKVVLTQREMGDLMGIATSDSVVVDAFVAVERTTGPLVVERVSPDEATAVVLRHRVPADVGWAAEADGSATAALIAGRPVLRLRWDPLTHSAEHALEHLREAT